MDDLLRLVRKLYPFPYSVTGRGNDDAVAAFQSELPFQVHEVASGSELNGWRTSPACHIEKAEIRKDGRLIYDGRASPLGVITLSKSFRGRVSLTELKEHLYFSSESEDAIPYHWTALYRPSERSWGFCVPHRLYQALEEGDYDVDLVATEKTGTMKVLDFLLPGDSSETVLLNAHNCHPFQANDDISGCAVGIRVLQMLRQRQRRRLSYRLVIAPELIGTVFWLDALGAKARDLGCTIMLKSVGNDRPLRLQQSFTGEAQIDKAAHHVFRHRFGQYDSGEFRTIYGNDETVFEAPPFEIPSISLTRFPFFGYHTNLDTPDTVSGPRLLDTAETALLIIDALEQNLLVRSTMTGLVALSHPRYGLYRAAPAPGIDREKYAEINTKWNLLMNCLSRHLNGRTHLLEIADRYGLPIADVHAYVSRFVEKGLAVNCAESTGAHGRPG